MPLSREDRDAEALAVVREDGPVDLAYERAIASGKLLLGLLTVIVFSVGFASVLVAVGVMAVQLGQAVLGWLSSGRVAWIQFGTALIVTGVGAALTLGAWWGLSV